MMPDPTKRGLGALAWRVPLDRNAVGFQAAWDASIATWLIEQPGVHVAWSRWLLNVCHLRPIPGAKAAHLVAQNMTHEFQFVALDPKRYSEHDTLRPRGWGFLTPPDLIHQVELGSDRDAERIMESAVDVILTGRASADSDFRAFWRTLLDGTAAHFRSGAHEEN